MVIFTAGHVVIVHFPFSDLTASKLRPLGPALVTTAVELPPSVPDVCQPIIISASSFPSPSTSPRASSFTT